MCVRWRELDKVSNTWYSCFGSSEWNRWWRKPSISFVYIEISTKLHTKWRRSVGFHSKVSAKQKRLFWINQFLLIKLELVTKIDNLIEFIGIWIISASYQFWTIHVFLFIPKIYGFNKAKQTSFIPLSILVVNFTW